MEYKITVYWDQSNCGSVDVGVCIPATRPLGYDWLVVTNIKDGEQTTARYDLRGFDNSCVSIGLPEYFMSRLARGENPYKDCAKPFWNLH